ncbi:MAG: hypothetical protein M3R15_32860 [Acidobacteriota bacterium]|nr:hypothetical protein [Acidobacteriota bacterium]
MSILKKLLLVTTTLIVTIIIIGGGWLWWNRPQKVDMSGYVPADSIVFIEANSLPDIVEGFRSTDAWRSLAPLVADENNLERAGWLSKLVWWTGIGPAEAVVLSRAQVAVTVIGFEANEGDATTLRIVPRAALVAETHTGEARVRAAVEKLVGDFARRAYRAPRIERKDMDGTSFVTWSAPGEPRRKIVAAVSESVAVIGNDEAVVESCLAARHGERPTLIGNPQLADARARLSAGDALAFGFVSEGNAAKLLEVAVLPYVGQLSSNQQIQSGAASLLPQLSNKILGVAGWSARVTNGRMEDRYFITLRNGLAPRMREALVASDDAAPTPAAKLLPADSRQVTQYRYQEPEAAWRGFNAAIASQLDALSAPFLSVLLDEALKPYGIESPRSFLRATKAPITTARLGQERGGTVLIVAVKDQQTLREQVRKRLGNSPRRTRVGEAEMFVSDRPERGAAGYVAEHLIMGSEESVRRCLEASANHQTLDTVEGFKRAVRLIPAGSPAGVLTLTIEDESINSFVSYLAAASRRDGTATNHNEFRERLERESFAVTLTELKEDGFMRQTFSAFGQLGDAVGRFAPQRTDDPDTSR